MTPEEREAYAREVIERSLSALELLAHSAHELVGVVERAAVALEAVSDQVSNVIVQDDIGDAAVNVSSFRHGDS